MSVGKLYSKTSVTGAVGMGMINLQFTFIANLQEFNWVFSTVLLVALFVVFHTAMPYRYIKVEEKRKQHTLCEIETIIQGKTQWTTIQHMQQVGWCSVRVRRKK